MVESATLNSFIIFAHLGIISGVFYNVLSIIKKITKKNILVVNVLDFFYCMICGFGIIYWIFKFEFGLFAVFEVVSFFFGMLFEQIIIKNLFTTPIKWVYNKIAFRRSSCIFGEVAKDDTSKIGSKS